MKYSMGEVMVSLAPHISAPSSPMVGCWHTRHPAMASSSASMKSAARRDNQEVTIKEKHKDSNLHGHI